jgi:predicted nucleotidyltransferase component of viral defense system
VNGQTNPTREGAKLIEVVHLALLQVLPSHMPVGDYVVKGGANLRLFYDSRRRSQDIDLDYIGSRPERIEDQVDRALASAAFKDLLRLGGVTVSPPTKPKQTPTTHRWKFAVSSPGGASLNSKIEFSIRSPVDPEHAFEQARADLGRSMGLRAVKAEHYLPAAAIRQKVRALADRRASEPRDVFDLDLLLGRYPDAVKKGSLDPDLARRAAAAAMTIEYPAFKELAVDFLEDEFVPIYDRPEVWTDMLLGVVTRLEALA